jgi:hypothetical protein
MSFLQKIINWLFGRRAAPEPQKQKRKRASKEHYGAHYYLGDLLDQLDAVFRDLPKFKKSDPEAYKLYSKIGASVRSSDGLICPDLEPHIAKSLPNFGCIYLGGDLEDQPNLAPLRFAYILKEKKPVNVQPTNETVYRCGLTFSLDHRIVATYFYVAIVNGLVRPLKVCRATQYPIGSTKRQTFFYRMEWRWPSALEELANKLDRDIGEYAGELFSIVANASYERERGVVVSVKKRGERAVFSIDMLRAPYFFSDREKVVNENGRTKKIFHYVRGHTRTTADGDEKFIKGHWRGLRKFSWNEYDVRIGMPGLHDRSLSEFTFDPLDPTYEGDDVVSTAELAEKFDGVLT